MDSSHRPYRVGPPEPKAWTENKPKQKKPADTSKVAKVCGKNQKNTDLATLIGRKVFGTWRNLCRTF